MTKLLLYPDGVARRAVPAEARAFMPAIGPAILAPCGGCGAKHGTPHFDDCPLEPCPRCGCQLATCACMHPGGLR